MIATLKLGELSRGIQARALDAVAGEESHEVANEIWYGLTNENLDLCA